MILPIVSLSALEFWMSDFSGNHGKVYFLNEQQLQCLPPQFRLITDRNMICDLANSYGFSLPLQIMAENDEGRKYSDLIRCKTYGGIFPPHSFFQIEEAVFVSCPELCFVQIAPELSLPRLIEAGNNLCSRYALNKQSYYQQEFRDLITDKASMKRFLDQTSNMKGIKKSRQALLYVLDDSNSPMESKLAVLVVLPIALGGYGIRKPVLNQTVVLPDEAARFLGRKTCKCDMVWEKEKVILEYDSNLTHLNKDQHSYDKRKYTALMLAGYKVIVVTADQLQNFRSVENLFQTLCKALGMEYRKQAMEKYRDKRWETVHELLFERR